MHAREWLANPELARVRHAGQIALGVAATDAVERRAGDDIEIPGLGIHRGRRAHRQRQDFPDQFLRNRIGLVTPDASPAENDVIELHVAFPEIGIRTASSLTALAMSIGFRSSRGALSIGMWPLPGGAGSCFIAGRRGAILACFYARRAK